MYNYSTLNIHFIRDSESSSEDDKLVIKPYLHCGSLVYNVEMKYSLENTTRKNNFNNTKMKKEELKEYIYRLFNLINMDAYPYKGYQFDLPLMPSIYVSPDNLEKSLHDIYNHFEMLLGSWPLCNASSSQLNYKNTIINHKFFDDDGNTIINE
jgi:hypothetical protein